MIAEGAFGPETSKTANSAVRYLPERIVAVVDTFDAITSDRPYRAALTID